MVFAKSALVAFGAFAALRRILGVAVNTSAIVFARIVLGRAIFELARRTMIARVADAFGAAKVQRAALACAMHTLDGATGLYFAVGSSVAFRTVAAGMNEAR